MAAMMNNHGYILANELDSLRCERLKYNVDKLGARIVEVSNGRGEVLGKKYENTFDKVLLDAPCSGEGRFLATDARTYRSWSEKTVKELAKLQRKLLKSAVTALKPGGEMVYSTCTLNREENEEILDEVQFSCEINKVEDKIFNEVYTKAKAEIFSDWTDDIVK